MDELILSVDQKTQYCKNVNSPQIDLHIFDAVSIISQQGFCGILKANSKMYTEMQRTKSKQKC